MAAQKLTDEKTVRTRAARKNAAGQVMQKSPVVHPSTGTESSAQAPTKPASMVAPGKRPAKPVRNGKPKAKASPARQGKKSPKRGGKGKTNATRRNRR